MKAPEDQLMIECVTSDSVEDLDLVQFVNNNYDALKEKLSGDELGEKVLYQLFNTCHDVACIFIDVIESFLRDYTTYLVCKSFKDRYVAYQQLVTSGNNVINWANKYDYVKDRLMDSDIFYIADDVIRSYVACRYKTLDFADDNIITIIRSFTAKDFIDDKRINEILETEHNKLLEENGGTM